MADLPEIPTLGSGGEHTLGPRARCAKCGYHLNGLAATGSCPECGGAYAPASVWFETKAAPTFAELAIRFGWPCVFLVFAGLAYGPRSSGLSGLLLAIFAVVLLINTPIQINLLIRSRVPKHLRTGWMNGVIILGRVTYISVGVVVLLTLAAPVLVLLACLTMK